MHSRPRSVGPPLASERALLRAPPHPFLLHASVVSVGVGVADEVQLVDAATLRASRDLLVLHRHPHRLVRLVLPGASYVSECVQGVDHDRLLHGSELGELDWLPRPGQHRCPPPHSRCIRAGSPCIVTHRLYTYMSKTSTPAILDRISSRSRPVDWSRSVGIVPAAAPGAMRSEACLMSGRSALLLVYRMNHCATQRWAGSRRSGSQTLGLLLKQSWRRRDGSDGSRKPDRSLSNCSCQHDYCIVVSIVAVLKECST